MSSYPDHEPDCLASELPSVELLIDGRPRDLGGFAVRRVLPSMARRLVGPFIFFDHMGPAHMPEGEGMDVRPHPHISLATVSFLFQGEIDHRDSLGSMQTICPGDVNWMLAGRGIAHSERSSPESRRNGVHIHGIQSWVALPIEHEDAAPTFEHHPGATLPKVRVENAVLDVIAGTSYGERSPVSVLSPTLYVHAQLEPGARVPIDDGHEQRAVYVVEGAISCDGKTFGPGQMLVLRAGAKVTITAEQRSRAMIVGGAKLAGERYVWWNFVSSSKERIERAKDDWTNRRFASIPGDDVEYIPLPPR